MLDVICSSSKKRFQADSLSFVIGGAESIHPNRHKHRYLSRLLSRFLPIHHAKLEVHLLYKLRGRFNESKETFQSFHFPSAKKLLLAPWNPKIGALSLQNKCGNKQSLPRKRAVPADRVMNVTTNSPFRGSKLTLWQPSQPSSQPRAACAARRSEASCWRTCRTGPCSPPWTWGREKDPRGWPCGRWRRCPPACRR